ncbi:MAG: FKBP-type peptidyl-prolyl cis-trans isomerase [Bacteroidales bacterium]|nr:FKBP-type peptidyl-prolyl cis-trans isomerase [Bacteroidales bacterium]
MKTNRFFAALMMGLAIAACSPKAGEKTPADGEAAAEDAAAQAPVKTAKDYQPSKAFADSVAYLVGVNFGTFIKGYDFGDLNYAQIKKGMDDFIKAKGSPRDPDFAKQLKIDPNKMNDMFNNFLEMRRNQKMLLNKEKEDKFLAANKAKKDVQTTESGLQYIVLEPGNENKPVDNRDTVWVRYKGTTLDGETFDEVPADADSVRFTLLRVVKGWQEGMKLIGEGGKIKLFVPSELGYGERGNQGIEPNSTLVFDIDLAKVSKFVPKEEETK